MSPYVIGQAILVHHRPEYKSKKLPAESSRVAKGAGNDKVGKPALWFCGGYNRNKCNKVSPHDDKVRGKLVQVHHICAACWIKNSSKQLHPECSQDCPLFAE